MTSINTKHAVWGILIFISALLYQLWLTWREHDLTDQISFDGVTMLRFIGVATFATMITCGLLTACVSRTELSSSSAPAAPARERPIAFSAQVVGVKWLNPLHRRDYSTEWELLWTLGLAQPNKNDDMVRANPKKYSSIQAIAPIAEGNAGKETFKGYHHKYLEELIYPMHDIYFSNSWYFYNAHSLTDKSTWRELAGIHVEYALPENKLDPAEAAKYTKNTIIESFSIGNTNFPNAWSRSTPPDINVTMGGANAGFTSLRYALDYLQAHPDETVWVMNWDAPSRPRDEQINENMVLLVLAGPHYKTERAALAWIGYPASVNVADFTPQKALPSAVQAWTAAFDAAARSGDKTSADIGYVIHDANNTHPVSSERIGHLAQTIAMELPGFDFMKQTFNTPALLGEMGAGTALTNVALAIGYANHLGKNVLVAGTTDLVHPTTVLVRPPAVVRPIDPEKPWFRARSANNGYLMWWGVRHDVKDEIQGYSK